MCGPSSEPTSNPVDDPEQEARIVIAEQGSPRDAERAHVARRDHRLFGTDPSWFGF